MLRPLLAGAVAASLLAVAPGPTSQARTIEQQKPNVIVIMTDDMRVDDLAAMPKTRRLIGAAKGKGATYRNAYANQPLCCPARATFLSGQYPHNHGVWDNAGDHGGFLAFDDRNRLPTWMKLAGYQTVMIGKYLNQYGYGENDPTYIPPGWDSWAAVVGGLRAWTNYRDFTVNRNETLQHIRDGYQTWNVTGRARSQLRQRLPSDQPVFLWVSYLAPHIDESARAKRDGYQVWAPPKYRVSRAPRPQSKAFNEAKVADKPPWVRARPMLGKRSVSTIVRLRRERRNALRALDESVADLVAELRRQGELSNTVLLFVSDNGFLLGEHRIVNKRFPYEESVSIPLLIRGPGITPGVRRAPVAHVDLAPTIADLAGIRPLAQIDGMSLLGDVPSTRPILLEAPKPFDSGRAYAAVRTPRWLYVEYSPQGRELYDMRGDPAQARNRIADPALRSVKTRLRELLDRLRDCDGRGCLP